MEVQHNEIDDYSELEHSPMDERAACLNRKQEFRKYVRHLCSFLGFSLCLLFVVIQLVATGLIFLEDFLAAYGVEGPGAVVYRIMSSEWFSVAGYNLLAYGVAVPIMMVAMRRVPETKIEPKKMRISKLLMFFVLCMGGGYIFNIIGNIINFFLAGFTGRNVYDMTPINSVMGSMTFATALYIGILGPIIEEYIFRGLILNRVRPLGEKAAIVLSAFLFGILHGNLSQFLYATSIGIILGYVASKTGTIFYSSILHIMVNSYSVILTMGLSYGLLSQGFGSVIFSLFIIGITFATIVASIVIFLTHRKKTRLGRGNIPAGVEYRDFSSAMFLNPGVLLFSFICCFLIFFYAFFS